MSDRETIIDLEIPLDFRNGSSHHPQGLIRHPSVRRGIRHAQVVVRLLRLSLLVMLMAHHIS
jgi:hypothetical protein